MKAIAQNILSTLPPGNIDHETMASIRRGMARIEKAKRAALIAAPMRAMMDMLASGEAYELDGHVVMSMPDIDERFAERAEWCAVAPALRGWIDCWRRLAPDLRTYYMGVLAGQLEADKPLTPRLVEQARAEFDATVERLVDIPDGQVSSAITTTQIAWELEKLTQEAA